MRSINVRPGFLHNELIASCAKVLSVEHNIPNEFALYSIQATLIYLSASSESMFSCFTRNRLDELSGNPELIDLLIDSNLITQIDEDKFMIVDVELR